MITQNFSKRYTVVLMQRVIIVIQPRNLLQNKIKLYRAIINSVAIKLSLYNVLLSAALKAIFFL